MRLSCFIMPAGTYVALVTSQERRGPRRRKFLCSEVVWGRDEMICILSADVMFGQQKLHFGNADPLFQSGLGTE